MHCNGKRMLSGILLALLICGCARAPASSTYKVQIPALTRAPKQHTCGVQDKITNERTGVSCTTLLTADYQQLVIELKTACLAAGGTDEECQTTPVEGPP